VLTRTFIVLGSPGLSRAWEVWQLHRSTGNHPRTGAGIELLYRTKQIFTLKPKDAIVRLGSCNASYRVLSRANVLRASEAAPMLRIPVP